MTGLWVFFGGLCAAFSGCVAGLLGSDGWGTRLLIAGAVLALAGLVATPMTLR